MSALSFLAIPLVTLVVGWAWLCLRLRQPRSVSSGVDEFRREMRALAPDGAGSSAGRSGPDDIDRRRRHLGRRGP